MVTIKKVWMDGCEPCKEVSKILAEVKTPFNLVELNITSTVFKERRDGKKLLGDHGTIKVPFLVFLNEDGEIRRAHFAETGLPTVDMIEEYIKQSE